MNKETGILYNRNIAILVMALLIALAGLLGVWKPLHKMEAEVSTLFWGDGKSGEVSINDDLQTRAGYASNLLVLTNKYNIDSGQLEKSIQGIKEGTKPKDRMSANQMLNDAISEIDKEFLMKGGSINVNEADQNALQSVVARLASQEDLIKRGVNKYNEAAKQYNHERGGFPANIFSRFVNLKPIPTI